MLGNLPVTVFNKCYLLMLTCILKTVKKKSRRNLPSTVISKSPYLVPALFQDTGNAKVNKTCYYPKEVQALVNFPKLLMKMLVAQSCPILCDTMACPWNSPGKNTRAGCHSLLQGIFPTWGLNPNVLHCRQILYHLSYQGSPELLIKFLKIDRDHFHMSILLIYTEFHQ